MQAKFPVLIALYPKGWRQRYGAEFTDLVTDLAATRSRTARLLLVIDIIRGAFDAHIHRGATMNRGWHQVQPALREGIRGGLLISLIWTTVLLLSNVVFPRSPDESDNDPEYLYQIFGMYLVFALLLIVIGVLSRRRGNASYAGAVGGAAAGAVMGLAVFAVSLLLDIAFFDTISQQHDKRVAFAASGWSSMRTFLIVRDLTGLPVVLLGLALIGGLLGGLGGLLRLPRRAPSGAA